MASGLPIVSTDVGGVVEVIEDGVTGLLAPPGNADALAAQVLRLAESRRARAGLARAGKELAVERFSEERMMAGYQSLYEEML
jgi:glycosyltransferase involved in cell wall biosynthesis